MTDIYEYSVQASIQPNYKPKWTGTYENNGSKYTIGVNQPLLSTLMINLTYQIERQKGGVYTFDGSKHTVNGTAVINGEDWKYTYSNYGTTLEREGKKVQGGYFDLLVKELTDDPSKVELKDLKGSANIYRWGSSVPSSTNTTTNNSTPTPAPEPEVVEESEEESFGDLFG